MVKSTGLKGKVTAIAESSKVWLRQKAKVAALREQHAKLTAELEAAQKLEQDSYANIAAILGTRSPRLTNAKDQLPNLTDSHVPRRWRLAYYLRDHSSLDYDTLGAAFWPNKGYDSYRVRVLVDKHLNYLMCLGVVESTVSGKFRVNLDVLQAKFPSVSYRNYLDRSSTSAQAKFDFS
jgi:hypothetical protein